MAALTGSVTVIASAAFFFAFLGVEHGPLAPAMAPTTGFLQEELGTAIDQATVTPARVAEERERTQAALGDAIVRLGQAQTQRTAFVPDLAKRAASAQEARREFLKGAFKLPLDWKGADFAMRERDAEAMAQPELGRMIVSGTRAIERKVQAAEAGYGRAVLAAMQAVERAAGEPTASRATIVAAATAASNLAERTAPALAPVVAREPSWGFGSIGDGALIPVMILGAGAFLLLAAGIGMMEGSFSTRTVAAHCDEKEKDVVVEMLVSEGTPYEVTRCSAFNGGPVTCEKRCLQWPAAHKQPLAHAA